MGKEVKFTLNRVDIPIDVVVGVLKALGGERIVVAEDHNTYVAGNHKEQLTVSSLEEAIHFVEGQFNSPDGDLLRAINDFALREKADNDIANEDYLTSFCSILTREFSFVAVQTVKPNNAPTYSMIVEKTFRYENHEWILPEKSTPFDYGE